MSIASEISKLTQQLKNKDIMPNIDKITLKGTDYTIVDSTVPSWAKQSTKPSYTASEISGLSTVATSGSYNDLTDKPTAYVTLVLTTDANNIGTFSLLDGTVLTNVEDIEAYDITQGYPEKLNLT